jgi:hypothetical protein
VVYGALRPADGREVTMSASSHNSASYQRFLEGVVQPMENERRPATEESRVVGIHLVFRRPQGSRLPWSELVAAIKVGQKTQGTVFA